MALKQWTYSDTLRGDLVSPRWILVWLNVSKCYLEILCATFSSFVLLPGKVPVLQWPCIVHWPVQWDQFYSLYIRLTLGIFHWLEWRYSCLTPVTQRWIIGSNSSFTDTCVTLWGINGSRTGPRCLYWHYVAGVCFFSFLDFSSPKPT